MIEAEILWKRKRCRGRRECRKNGKISHKEYIQGHERTVDTLHSLSIHIRERKKEKKTHHIK